MAKQYVLQGKGLATALLLVLCGWVLPSFGQINDWQPASGGFAIGMHATSRGLGVELELAKGSLQRQFLYGLSLYQIKDLREVQIDSFFGDQGRSYVFGKLNHFAILQPSFGIQRDVIPKTGLNILRILAGVKIGPSIGFLNPYFLEIYSPAPNPATQNRTIVPFNPAEHSYGRIYGKASLVSSRLELTPQLGMGLKTFVIIDFGREKRNISALKLGANVDGYLKPVEILSEREDLSNKRLFLSLSAGLLFGKRW